MDIISFLLFIRILFISLKYTITSKVCENIWVVKWPNRVLWFLIYIFLSQKIYSLESGEIDTATHFSDHFHFICDKFKILNGTALSSYRTNSILNMKCTILSYWQKIISWYAYMHRTWNIFEMGENSILSVSIRTGLHVIRNWNSVSNGFTFIVPLLGKEIYV